MWENVCENVVSGVIVAAVLAAFGALPALLRALKQWRKDNQTLRVMFKRRRWTPWAARRAVNETWDEVQRGVREDNRFWK